MYEGPSSGAFCEFCVTDYNPSPTDFRPRRKRFTRRRSRSTTEGPVGPWIVKLDFQFVSPSFFRPGRRRDTEY